MARIANKSRYQNGGRKVDTLNSSSARYLQSSERRLNRFSKWRERLLT
jgi:hypothetical protein